MAGRKKKEIVSMDEVREEMAQAPVEEVDTETQEGQEEGAPEASETETHEVVESEPAYLEGETYKLVEDTRIVRVALTKDELIEQGRIMIEAMDEAERARASLKALSAEIKADEERARERANEAKALMRSRHEDRSVDCHQVHNWTRDKVYTVRLDTGEIIGVRGMHNYERQIDIPEGADQGDNDGAALEADGATNVQDESEGELVGVGAGDNEEGEI